ncbi:asparagine synthase (glutamine-hydrolyzing) [Amycolatopsis sp. NPDC059021]|uniref:asparagine synthase (glutamine-hydrolyzing) n=1 Tax=Amycolatopsis sp. NPDC059021 TaxID=3346704 RepID=UPI00366CD179
MCGFCGVVGTGPWRDTTSRLTHRGPDDEGVFTGDGVALGFRRLAIIDPTPAGHQPMSSADGRYVIVFNGEIYNYRELAEHLGTTPRSRCDTEVLLELFAALGPEVLHRLRGMFAFAVWDTERRELFAARDGFGIKPFFYAVRDGALWFASEKKALVEIGAHGEVDTDSLRRYLSVQYVPGPDTMATDVKVLEPGQLLTFRPGEEPRISRWWRPRLRPAAKPDPGSPQRILAALEDSVAAHLRSDVPLGAFLSGGVDSAAICALAARHRPDLKTFTVGFEREGYSEIDRAEETAAALGVRSYPYVITPGEFAANLPRIVWHLDEPFADAAAIALWFLAREARKHVKVVLSGEGADELFGGYHVYREAGPGYLGADQVYVDEEVDQVAVVPGANARELTTPILRRARAEGLDEVAARQLVDLSLWLPGDILTKADRMTMAHGLELRVPFLDREVLAVAAGLAPGDKIAEDTTKYALRRAVSAVVPEPVATRAKLGFPVPIRFWLRDELHDFAEHVLGEACTDRYVDRDAAFGMLKRYRDGEDFDWRRLWVLVCFSLWHQVHVEGRYDPAALGWSAEAAR